MAYLCGMNKREGLKWCDWSLALLLVFTLASGVWLEVAHAGSKMAVFIHITVATVFMSDVIWHIYLHFGFKKWLNKFGKMKIYTRILWWVYVLTFLSGIAAAVHWLITMHHSPVGGVHGKIGFVMILMAAGHALRRRVYYVRSLKK